MSSNKRLARSSSSEVADENSGSSSKLYYSVVPQSTDSSKVTKFGDSNNDDESTVTKRRSKTSNAAAAQTSYIVQGHNGASLVDQAMEKLQWTKITDKSSDGWKMKWTETKGMVNYSNFKEGEQLVNHIPNCELICNKLGLLTSLREYERVTISVKNRPPKLQLADFLPETYVVDDKREREMFFDTFKPGEIWINKPTGLNQGKGIFLIRDLDKFKSDLQEKNDLEKPVNNIKSRKSMGRIVQRYILNPLLIHERKFDIRSYMLIACTSPFLVLFHHGYIRLSIHKYSNDDSNLCTHLTNQYIQKKDAAYEGVKDDTVWSMEQFNDYLNSLVKDDGSGPPEKDWVFNGMEKQMKAILGHMFAAVKHKLTCKVGFFELYGIDFMIDQDYKMSLLEVNTNPAMHVNCALLAEILPPLIEKSIHLALECFEKCKRRQALFPLKTLSTFSVISSGGSGNSRSQRGASPQAYRFNNVQPRYQNHSTSPPSRNVSSASPDSLRLGKSSTANPIISPSLPLYTSPPRRSPLHLSRSKDRPFEHSLRRYDPILWDPNKSSTFVQVRSSTDKSSTDDALKSVKQEITQPSADEVTSEVPIQFVGQSKIKAPHSLTSVTSDSLWNNKDAAAVENKGEMIDENGANGDKDLLFRRDFTKIRTTFKRETAPISTVRVVSSNDAVRLKMSVNKPNSLNSGRANRRRHVDRSS